MPSPQFTVEAVAFQGTDVNVLPLLVGRVPVSGPQWTRSGARSPAALVAPAGGGRVTIAVSFSCPELAGQTITVSATRMAGAVPAIQHVEPRQVTLDAFGQTGNIPLTAVISDSGIDLGRVRWQWRFERNGATLDGNVTEHEIAVVLGQPRQPWTTATDASTDATLPRWDVLQRACQIARGARTLPEATAKITHTAFEVWGQALYRWDEGAETFASDSGDAPPAFDCDRFLALLDSPPPAKEIVDCSDIATIVSTFAAILGCPVEQLTLRGLNCSALKLVGHDAWEFAKGFPLHELAVSVPLAADPQVWDGCLMVSGDATVGAGNPTIALLPAGMDGSEYFRRLLSTSGLVFGQRIRRGPLTRPIRPFSNRLLTLTWDEELKELAQRYGFDAWLDPVQRVVRSFNPMTVAGDSWRVLVETALPAPDPVDSADAVARMVCSWPNDARRRLRVTVYLCADVDAAHRRLLYLLGRFPERLPPVDGVPGVAFVSNDGKSIMGATMNVAYRIIDAGESPAVSGPDAPRLRAALTTELEKASQPS